ncbi:MAG TPA: YraN family protein [Rhodocyclaceae bacterium]|nr:YraN family protein [Rhodocyclaceae bacterium]
MGALANRLQEVWHCLLRACGGQAASANNASGAKAEVLAARYLEKHGARILARNVRYKGGEIDLIAEHAGAILFVEVRFRQHANFGGAAGSITTTKQRRIILASRMWLSGTGRAYANRNCRFDAMLLDGLNPKNIEWLQAAFSC